VRAWYRPQERCRLRALVSCRSEAAVDNVAPRPSGPAASVNSKLEAGRGDQSLAFAAAGVAAAARAAQQGADATWAYARADTFREQIALLFSV